MGKVDRMAFDAFIKIHAFEHLNDRKLEQLWKEISDAFA